MPSQPKPAVYIWLIFALSEKHNMKIACIYTITICRLLNHRIPKLNLPPEWLRSFYVQLRIRTARVAGVSMYQEPACTQTLVYFSFGSFRKHRWARERVRSIYFFSSPHPTTLRWRSINPPWFSFFITRARQTLKRKERVCEQARQVLRGTTRKTIRYGVNTYPIWLTLHFRYRRVAA